MTESPSLSPDAATVLGLAGTALPFAGSPYEQSERWLRALRLYGDAGAALQGIGVTEAPLEGASPRDAARDPRVEAEVGDDVVDRVTAAAAEIASQRGEAAIGTVDLLYAVMRVYGPDFEQALDRRGATGAELVERLGRLPG